MAQIYTYLVTVDGYSLATDSRETVAWLFKQAKSTMTVSEWDDGKADYVSVRQDIFQSW